MSLTQKLGKRGRFAKVSVPLFRDIKDKEKFLIVVSALKLRLVSLARASEIMHMTKTGFLELLELLDIDYSYLSENDIEKEKTWPQ